MAAFFVLSQGYLFAGLCLNFTEKYKSLEIKGQ